MKATLLHCCEATLPLFTEDVGRQTCDPNTPKCNAITRRVQLNARDMVGITFGLIADTVGTRCSNTSVTPTILLRHIVARVHYDAQCSTSLQHGAHFTPTPTPTRKNAKVTKKLVQLDASRAAETMNSRIPERDIQGFDKVQIVWREFVQTVSGQLRDGEKSVVVSQHSIGVKGPN